MAALLHNNRVYRMADEWVDYCPLSSYVLGMDEEWMAYRDIKSLVANI